MTYSWVSVAISTSLFLLLVSSSSVLISLFPDEIPSSVIIDSNKAYGFAIPLPSGTDTTFETFLNSRTRVLVNDLLREKVTVYWTTEQVHCLVLSIFDMNRTLDCSFEKGTFIIPYVGYAHQDTLMSSIIFDYCIDAELDDFLYPLEGYLLLEPLSVKSIELVEPKIAQHFGTSIRYGWPVYLQIADAGGFLSFDFFLDGEIETLLQLDTYNVFMWPYEPKPARMTETFTSLINKQSLNELRHFVSQGGGYIGSCYGAQVASSGFLQPFSLLSLRYAYQPDKHSYPFSLSASISDTIMNIRFPLLKDLFISTSIITNFSHPLAFSINKTLKDFFSGPWFVYLGKNSECVSIFDTITLETSDSPPVIQKIIGTPNWVTSTFGKGKVVLFASHPEFVNNISLLFESRIWPEDHYYGRRVIQNSIFYVTGKSNQIPMMNHCLPFSTLKQLKIKTTNLYIPLYKTQFFDSTITRLIEYSVNLSRIQNLSSELMMLYSDVFSDELVFQNDSKPLLYAYHISYILQDYTQKTIQNLQLMEHLTALNEIDQNKLLDSYSELDGVINANINQSQWILQISLNLTYQIEKYLRMPSFSMMEKINVVEESREMITTLESSLKYVPQMHFESMKILRHFWYQYESTVAC